MKEPEQSLDMGRAIKSIVDVLTIIYYFVYFYVTSYQK